MGECLPQSSESGPEGYDFSEMAERVLLTVNGHDITFGDALNRCESDQARYALLEILEGDPLDPDRELFMEALKAHVLEKTRESGH